MKTSISRLLIVLSYLLVVFGSFQMLASIADASVVPGTIQKGAYTKVATCGTSTTSYSPTGGTYAGTRYAECRTSACGVQSYNSCAATDCGIQSYNSCANAACGSIKNASGAIIGYNSCATPACGVQTYRTCATPACGVSQYNSCRASACGYDQYTSQGTGLFSLTDFTDSLQIHGFGSSGYSQILDNDASETCGANAFKSKNKVEPGYGTWYCPMGNCYPPSITTRVGGESAVCGRFDSKDNLISFYNQLGSISRVKPVDLDASCTVEGRYAQSDIFGPDITVTGLSVFDSGDQNFWCNYNEYRKGTSPISVGCKFYRDRAGTDDLLQDIAISVKDVSGITMLEIELGKCKGKWGLPNDLGTILVSATSPSGVDVKYQAISVTKDDAYHGIGGFHRLGAGMAGIFGVSRLDECLGEGKNYLKVTTRDSARSNTDGVSLDGNGTVQDYQSYGYIKIDNTTPKIGLGGHMMNFADSNTDPTCMVGPAFKDGANKEWKNFTLKGTIRTTDPFGDDATDCAPSVVTKDVGLKCLKNKAGVAKPADPSVIWTAPSGVSPTTGSFTGKLFGTLGPIPDITSCEWSCSDPSKKYDPAQGKCVSSTKLFILFDSGTAEASGPTAAKLDSDLAISTGLLKEKSSACSAPSPTGTKSFTNFKYFANGTYKFLPEVTQYPIVENGVIACPPAEVVYTYSWYTGAFGACTGACGVNGTQNRQVYCKRNDGAISQDSFCTGTKPIASQACSMPACPAVPVNYMWKGDWGTCGTSCPATRTRTLHCESDIGTMVSDTFCAGIPQPAVTDTSVCTPCAQYAQCVVSDDVIGWDNSNYKFSHGTFFSPNGGVTWEITGVSRVGSQGIGNFSTAPDGDPDKTLSGIGHRYNGDQRYHGYYCKRDASIVDIAAFMDNNAKYTAYRYIFQPQGGFLVPVQYSRSFSPWGPVPSESGFPMFFFAEENGGFLEYENDYYVDPCAGFGPACGGGDAY